MTGTGACSSAAKLPLQPSAELRWKCEACGLCWPRTRARCLLCEKQRAKREARAAAAGIRVDTTGTKPAGTTTPVAAAATRQLFEPVSDAAQVLVRYQGFLAEQAPRGRDGAPAAGGSCRAAATAGGALVPAAQAPTIASGLAPSVPAAATAAAKVCHGTPTAVTVAPSASGTAARRTTPTPHDVTSTPDFRERCAARARRFGGVTPPAPAAAAKKAHPSDPVQDHVQIVDAPPTQQSVIADARQLPHARCNCSTHAFVPTRRRPHSSKYLERQPPAHFVAAFGEN